MEGLLILPKDIRVVPVSGLPREMRAEIGVGDDGFAITRPLARVPSKIVDAQSWALLEQFKEPKTLVDAVLHYSRAANAKPSEVFDEAFPLLESLYQTRLLVKAESEDVSAIKPSLATGDVVAGWEIVRNIQTLADTELYQVRTPEGEVAALKIERAEAPRHVASSFDQEARLLFLLMDHSAVPKLIASGVEGKRHFLVMEWRQSGDVMAAAARLRAGSDPHAVVGLCAAILESYAELHESGVLHGDVHPKNLLVSPDGKPTILDFGLASTNSLPAATRGGVGAFFEPEYARAVLAAKKPPAVTALGEQYSVAALIYMLLSGAPYADFAVEREAMMRQIAEVPPAPLAARNCFGHPAVEGVLQRALSKQSGKRWTSMRQFSDAFREAADDDLQTSERFSLKARSAAPDFVNRVLDRIAVPSRNLGCRDVQSPVASVTYGAAGIACALHRIAVVRQDGELFARADTWAEFAASLESDPQAFFEPSIGIQPLTVGSVSPYHTRSGIHTVRALLAHARGDSAALNQAVGLFLEASREPNKNLDLTLGRGSTLMALSLIVGAAGIQEQLVEFGNKLLASVWDELDSQPPIAECESIAYLGMAHGWAGILYFSMCWARLVGAEPYRHVATRLDELARFAIPTDSGIVWPWSRRRKGETMPGWCNGNAGFLFLWTLAHEMCGYPRFLALAQQTAPEVARAEEAGASLCCGATGQAYALLNLYRHTGDRKWLEGAQHLAGDALEIVQLAEARGEPAMPLSLYKGELGLAVLLEDLRRPESAVMPFFQCEQWPASSS
jgi:serine/threonine protein kinase